MAVVPSPQALLSVSEVMADSLDCLHEIIETECDPKSPKEAMVLMMAFIQGVTLQLKDKVEALGKGLGDELLAAVNEMTKTNSTARETIEKMNRGDPSLNESTSGIDPKDELGAIEFMRKGLLNGIVTYSNQLPFFLRDEDILFHSLSAVIASLFVRLGNTDADFFINSFSKNIRVFIDAEKKNEIGDQACH